MTNLEYIKAKLPSLNIGEASLLDAGIDPSAEYEPQSVVVGRALVNVVEDQLLAPQMSSVNEQGFSISYDTKNLGKYYYYLCRKWGVTPNKDVISMLDLSTVSDISNLW